MDTKKILILLALLPTLNLLSNPDSRVPVLFPQNLISPIISHNRATLSLISQWIDNELYAISNYGLPEHVRALVDLPIGNDITYSDAMIYLSKFLRKNINYLELGTSFGKNFLQVANALSNSTLVGFDVEKISPVLESFLSNSQNIDSWKTMPNSVKHNDSSLTKYDQQNRDNTILYLSGDIYDENSWKRLQGIKFNMVFSDACHAPDALRYEYQMLEKYDLIDPDEFVFIWDDLHGDMRNAFMEIFTKLSKKFNLDSNKGFILPLRGWLGIHEEYHPVGIIMNLKK